MKNTIESCGFIGFLYLCHLIKINVNMLLRKLFVLIFCFAALSANAQKVKSHSIVKNFITTAPDTIVQGIPFTVEYRLESKRWEKGAHALQGKGFALKHVTYSTINGNPYAKLLTRATYIYHGCSGETIETPGMLAYLPNDSIIATPKQIYVKPHPQYGEEMDIAVKWLMEQGRSLDSICLSATFENEYLRIFDDNRYDCFCMVAKKHVWPWVGHPILAYSTESPLQYKNSGGWGQLVVQSYNKQIEKLKSSNVKQAMEATLASDKALSPLLGNLTWGQREPYNYHAPTLRGKKMIIGCVPLAVGMLLNYHKWPKQGMSHMYYRPDSKMYKLDFTKFSPKWDEYKESYAPEDTMATAIDLSNMLAILAYSLDASFTNSGTSAKIANVKHVLCNNLGYSGKMNYYYKTLQDAEFVSLLYEELNHKRPCLLSNDGHAFVCDGYKGDFFHYNLGWQGYCNGYYRLKLGDYTPTSESLLMPVGILCGVEPQFQDYAKEVTLSAPGTLEDCFTEEEKAKVTSLTLTGKINSKDIAFIRQLAGAQDSVCSMDRGSLKVLDLQNVTICSDKNPYLVTKASGGYSYASWQSSYNGTRISDLEAHSFDFEDMDEKQWKKFKATVGSKQPSVYYTRTDDNEYYAHYKCQKNVIGDYMFKGCTSLNTIMLPLKTKAIGDAAFVDCTSLQTIRIPKSVKEIDKYVFAGCSSLELVELPRASELRVMLDPSCSPAIRIGHYR